MNSMENFFNWISKPIPEDELIIWLNIHNMNYEKIKREIIKKQRALQPEIAREIWETNIDEMYNLFEEHKERKT